MSKHPYPRHVIEAVAKALMKSSETRDAFGAGGDWEAAGHAIKQEFVDHANTALQALWEASRIDTREELERLHAHALIVDAEGYWFQKDEYAEPEDADNGSWPMHAVYYWGDAE